MSTLKQENDDAQRLLRILEKVGEVQKDVILNLKRLNEEADFLSAKLESLNRANKRIKQELQASK